MTLLTILTVAIFMTTGQTQHTQDKIEVDRSAKRCPDHHVGLRFYRGRYTVWMQLRGIERISTGRKPRSCADAHWLAKVWRVRARVAKVKYVKHELARKNRFRNLYEKWRCIHEHEGAWNANTGNGYYGGLQMDISFQLAHGRRFYERWGTANNWPVWAQLAAAEDAYRTRGFSPWPNTARYCGLL